MLLTLKHMRACTITIKDAHSTLISSKLQCVSTGYVYMDCNHILMLYSNDVPLLHLISNVCSGGIDYSWCYPYVGAFRPFLLRNVLKSLPSRGMGNTSLIAANVALSSCTSNNNGLRDGRRPILSLKDQYFH